jgi:hypothetical protein
VCFLHIDISARDNIEDIEGGWCLHVDRANLAASNDAYVGWLAYLQDYDPLSLNALELLRMSMKMVTCNRFLQGIISRVGLFLLDTLITFWFYGRDEF